MAAENSLRFAAQKKYFVTQTPMWCNFLCVGFYKVGIERKIGKSILKSGQDVFNTGVLTTFNPKSLFPFFVLY
jgi:hypothetical protein